MLDLLAAAGVAASAKDLEIALLRQQLRVLERKTNKARLSRPEKLMLVAEKQVEPVSHPTLAQPETASLHR